MRRLLPAVALALALALACVAPARVCPPRGGRCVRVVGVALDGPWGVDAAPLRAAVARVRMPGVRFVEDPRAWLLVRAQKALGCGPEYPPDCRARGTYSAPGWFGQPAVIRLDVGQLPTPEVWRATMAHELAHAVGGTHVCEYPRQVRVCSPVGYGRAILNPGVPDVDPLVEFTALDLAELRRVHALPEGY